MKTLFELIKEFEIRNNTSIEILIQPEVYCKVIEFWGEEILYEGASEHDLRSFLENTVYELDENGRCYDPIRKKITNE